LGVVAWSLQQREKTNDKSTSGSITEPAQPSSNPLLTLFKKYPPLNPFKRGNRQDDWGSFFLLAITEHLREQGQNRPHYAEAYALLRAVRIDAGIEKSRSATKLPKNTAATRITNVKKAYPDWAQDLSLLRDQYVLALRNRAEVKSNPDTHLI
jgi:hypothetical protein